MTKILMDTITAGDPTLRTIVWTCLQKVKLDLKLFLVEGILILMLLFFVIQVLKINLNNMFLMMLPRTSLGTVKKNSFIFSKHIHAK